MRQITETTESTESTATEDEFRTPETVASEPVAEAPHVETAPFDVSARENGAARVPNSTMDLLTGDDVLDLPPVVPSSQAVEHSRGDVVAVAREARDRLDYDGFQPF